jgi:hypothetical protein
MSQYGTEPAGASAYETEPALGTQPSYGTGSETGSTTDQVKDQVRDKAQVAQDKARGAVGQARGRISEQVDQRSTQAGERLSGQAADVRSIADELRKQGKEGPATIAEQVAGQADRVGDYLKGASGDRILRDVEDFARRQPWLVAASGLVLGFAASRFMKASSSQRYRSGYGNDAGDGGYRSYAIPSDRLYDTSATTGTAITADPAYTGSDYGTEATYTGVTTETPVVGSFDPDPIQGEPLRDPLDERRS